MAEMTFGRHKGLDSSEVPVEYLLWAAETMAPVPACVKQEIDRRYRRGGRDALICQERLGSRIWNAKARRQRRRRRKTTSQGEQYDAARARWLAEGGDPGSVPWED